MSLKVRCAKLAAGLLGVSALLAIGAVAAWYRLDASLPPRSAHYVARGLSAEVRIGRDIYGIPHIAAATQDDAYFALGFAHAQDRLWQMEWHRRLALGRLAEIVGARGVASDKLARLLGFGRLADQGIGFLSDDVHRAFLAYAAGINAWLAQGSPLPIEFVMLQARPEPWRDTDSLAIWRGMAAQLSYNVRDELLLGRAAGRLTPAELQAMFPGQVASMAAVDRSDAASALDRTRTALRSLPQPGASNVWAVAGSHTASGKPILANDPHTSFGEPALWYLAQIAAPGLDVTGATIPGFPLVVLGHNRDIAWGMTSNGFDVQDLFLEDVDPADPGKYQTPDGGKPFTIHHETIAVAGQAAQEFEARETRHGPVLSDVGLRAAELASAEKVVALAYSGGLADDPTAESLFRINRAKNWTQFLEALKLWRVPAQNFVMASVDGDIGMASVGLVPMRKGSDGRMPRLGASGQFDWDGNLAFDQMPVTLNPASGVIVNANDDVAPGRSSLFGDPVDEPFRAQRIAVLLNSSPKQRPKDSIAIQKDIAANEAAALLPLLLRAHPGDSRDAEAVSLLRGWDRTMDSNRPEPLIYVAWLRELSRSLFSRRLGNVFDDYWQIRPKVLVAALNGHSSLCAPPRASCEGMLAPALSKALDDLTARYGGRMTQWRWGDAHVALLRHPILAEIPLVNVLTAIESEVDGGSFTVNRSDVMFSNKTQPYTAVFGAEFRAVYDLGDLSNSRFVISTGQSGQLASTHRHDLNTLWSRGVGVTIAGLAPNGGRVTTVAPLP